MPWVIEYFGQIVERIVLVGADALVHFLEVVAGGLALGLALAAFLGRDNGNGGANQQLALTVNNILVQSRNLISYLIAFISFDDDLAAVDDVDTLLRSREFLTIEIIDTPLALWRGAGGEALNARSLFLIPIQHYLLGITAADG